MIRCPVCKNLFNHTRETIECPVCGYNPPEEDGIIQFATHETDEYFFPIEGFSTLYQHEADHFWFRSRNKVIGSFIERFISNTQYPIDMIRRSAKLGVAPVWFLNTSSRKGIGSPAATSTEKDCSVQKSGVPAKDIIHVTSMNSRSVRNLVQFWHVTFLNTSMMIPPLCVICMMPCYPGGSV
jgi:hypothetical protein